MNVHEFQAKGILSGFDVRVPKGVVVRSVEEVDSALGSLAAGIVAVKAQIHAGGRGKAGGVKIGKAREEVADLVKSMLGSVLVTHQTSAAGQKVHAVYLEEGVSIKKEYYLGAVVDRKAGMVSVIFSSEGGMDIEEVAHSRPEMVVVVNVDPVYGFLDFHGRKLCYGLGLKKEQVVQITAMARKVCRALMETDASQVEINPLVETTCGEFIALDAKMTFDDNGLFRRPEIVKLTDPHEYSEEELEAAKYGLSYIKLDGNIGCMVNGAGLAMATMDIVKYYGGEPANFLDVGGGASKDTVREAFKIILRSGVDGILVNIFGGIMRCDVIAAGIIESAKEIGVSVPMVVRLSGTNYKIGKEMLDASGLSIVTAENLDEAARFVVDLVGKRG
ncbi:ADP-forming succinate--CoA ligase subunit beta [Anaplasma phagocytophilum]|uniref:Succinate--CoA ligase [ADP-forming] subunit beta n=3 Tax=Anaplasma phagocytophilum TaxID=948 RepID=SUCC_ANAPZ|nr:ADP-forming succinate--CoA ligase subunit beta [Anaplasma phagocytophilum]Q2GJ42.1 RecName: Full=Succinate--CoA ligase [ADP-forming] subunit beta; AltName: Full=Succinyl-CoA synthetase subunit beta; Short=SCS-beta [Anaplasma phagocytophilum str. HZ]KJZ99456.1 succinate-CoA ligase, beta subunit [Anaplasma phagocytophilum str. CR1007]ABD44388.1 succinyl-CoA synthetase, beta subunit [Anaplasma phagocytophilum str. HZ]EOA61285.1 succinyl-CoA synthetase subunit beta [Anaplasma phagocytophilum str